ncbi:MAG: DNA mismatch repair protein MutS, partial [Chloroflexi bacterium]|nr:DNA mismatch repair protein MutS [Chloroflexota bacterium]
HNHPRLGAKTLFATHYHELTALAETLPRVRNYHFAVAEEGGEVVFLRRLLPGGADRSYGIHVARLAGLPPAVTHRAEEILAELEGGGGARREGTPPRGPRRRRNNEEATQLALFGAPHPVVEELLALDLESLTPLDALNRLYALQQRARNGT